MTLNHSFLIYKSGMHFWSIYKRVTDLIISHPWNKQPIIVNQVKELTTNWEVLYAKRNPLEHGQTGSISLARFQG